MPSELQICKSFTQASIRASIPITLRLHKFADFSVRQLEAPRAACLLRSIECRIYPSALRIRSVLMKSGDCQAHHFSVIKTLC